MGLLSRRGEVHGPGLARRDREKRQHYAEGHLEKVAAFSVRSDCCLADLCLVTDETGSRVQIEVLRTGLLAPDGPFAARMAQVRAANAVAPVTVLVGSVLLRPFLSQVLASRSVGAP